MTVLVGSKLVERLNEADPRKRLVVGPLLEPTEQITMSQASIDVRLGCDFRLATAANTGVLDEFAESSNPFIDLPRLYTKVYVPLGGGVTIHPHQLMLGVTLEYLRLPNDLMAYVVGRSSFGRLGLIIATAVGIHPTFSGPLTLELRNLGEAPLRLYPGQTIAQLFFHQLDPSDPKPVWPGDEMRFGQYTASFEPVTKRISSEVTAAKLGSLRRKYESGERLLRGSDG